MLQLVAITGSERQQSTAPDATIRRRVKELMAEHSMTVADLARAAGKTGPWATAFLKGRRNIPTKTQEKIAAHFRIPAWKLQVEDEGTTKETNVPKFSAVPIMPRSVGAGQPIEIEPDADATEYIAFKDDFTRRFTKPIAVRVGRDQQSMMPTIHPGDLLVVDQNIHGRLRPNPRLIYALNLDGGATIKRVEVVDGKLIISSDSLDKDKYSTYTRPIVGVDLTGVIVGEVVWIGRYIGSGRKPK